MFAKKPIALEPGAIAKALAIALLSGSLLAACAPAEDDTGVAADQPASAPAPAATEDAARAGAAPEPAAAGGTVGGDGSEIQLDPLTEPDVADADLAGELACSFSTGDARPILHATGVVASDDPAQGIVKVSGYVEPVRAPGGFDGMTKDPTFTGQGKTIRIVETGDAIGGGESPPRPATLTYQRADGASRTFEGRWQCGP
ncbi:hypothetical protein H0E84_12690 [Luteimonas sp. SJ-92]|uniref:DUF3455 domain-containing protein n=1 Tax=Luteimonas salinisoli TaxID=2752307 RepID=A0A853JFC6_9GAMM|nr:hypothetical protein [Luteimonas salinisoli]NZA27240.1 hypothetical protein [Luteimonas salinisoli]